MYTTVATKFPEPLSRARRTFLFHPAIIIQACCQSFLWCKHYNVQTLVSGYHMTSNDLFLITCYFLRLEVVLAWKCERKSLIAKKKKRTFRDLLKNLTHEIFLIQTTKTFLSQVTIWTVQCGAPIQLFMKWVFIIYKLLWYKCAVKAEMNTQTKRSQYCLEIKQYHGWLKTLLTSGIINFILVVKAKVAMPAAVCRNRLAPFYAPKGSLYVSFLFLY